MTGQVYIGVYIGVCSARKCQHKPVDEPIIFLNEPHIVGVLVPVLVELPELEQLQHLVL